MPCNGLSGFCETIHKAAVQRIGFRVAFLFKFSNELTLAFGKLCRDFNEYLDNLVALAITPDIRHTKTAHTEQSAGLCAGRNFQVSISLQGRDAYRSAKRRLWKTQGHFAIDVIAVAFENLIPLNFNQDVQIAARTALFSRFAFTGDTQPLTGVDASGNVDRNFALNADATVSTAP